MKRTDRFRRTAALLAAAAVMVNLAGCREQEKAGSTLAVTLEHAYKAQQLAPGTTDSLQPVQLTEQLLWLANEETDILYDNAAGTFSDSDFVPVYLTEDPGEGRTISDVQYSLDADGYLHIYYINYGAGMEDIRYYREIYDDQLERTAFQELTFDSPERLTAFHRDGEGNYYCLRSDSGMQVMAVYDKDCQYLGDMKPGFIYVTNLFTGSDGRVYGASGQGYSCEFFCADPETLQCEPVTFEGCPPSVKGIAGDALYERYFYNSEGIYGLVLEEMHCEKVLDWQNSDFDGRCVEEVAAIGDGRFLVFTQQGDSNIHEIHMLEARTPEEIADLHLISLAAIDPAEHLREAVRRFNRSRTDCRIVIADYGEYNTEENDTLGLSRLRQDMVDGIVADIICTDGLPFASFANKGLFEDLYPFMKKDRSFHEEDYLMNFFQSLEYGGKLQRIGGSCSIFTMAGKTAYLGDAGGLDAAAYMALLAERPEGMAVFTEIMDKESAFETLCLDALGGFVDTKNNTCSFDSDAFIELLELCGSFPDTSPEDETLSQEALEAYVAERDRAFRQDTALLYPAEMRDPFDYHDMTAGVFGEEITLLGLPTTEENCSGALFCPEFTVSMSSQSKYQAEIWEFIRCMLDEEYQSALQNILPVHRTALAKRAEAATKPLEVPNGDGTTRMEMRSVSLVGVAGGNATAEEMAYFTEYAESITRSRFEDAAVRKIVSEEADMYFAGDCAVQEAAAMIQSRVSLYLSEQY